MKCIIAGGRDIADKRVVWDAIKSSGWHGIITEVVSGGARGVDTLGEQYAEALELDLHRMPARWKSEGKSAGPKRNQRMADYCRPLIDGLIAVWDGQSRGTAHMIECAKRRGLTVYVHRV